MEILANTDQEYLDLLKSNESIVRSLADLDKVRSDRSLEALAKLDERTYSAFKERLDFNDLGLKHSDWAMLNGVLSDTEVSDVFKLFGISNSLFKDYTDKYCVAKGDCGNKFYHVCTSNC